MKTAFLVFNCFNGFKSSSQHPPTIHRKRRNQVEKHKPNIHGEKSHQEARTRFLALPLAGADRHSNTEGARTTPSVVAFAKSGERLVGQAAKRQAITNAQNTVFSIKPFMGRRFEEVQDEAKRVPYKIVKASNGDAYVEVTVGGTRETFSPPEISAMILGKLTD